MDPNKRFERVLRDLNNLEQKALRGMRMHSSLDAKVTAQGMGRLLKETRNRLRLLSYEFEEIVRPLANAVEEH